MTGGQKEAICRLRPLDAVLSSGLDIYIGRRRQLYFNIYVGMYPKRLRILRMNRITEEKKKNVGFGYENFKC